MGDHLIKSHDNNYDNDDDNNYNFNYNYDNFIYLKRRRSCLYSATH